MGSHLSKYSAPIIALTYDVKDLFRVAVNINPFFLNNLPQDLIYNFTSSTCSTISKFKIMSNFLKSFKFSGEEFI